MTGGPPGVEGWDRFWSGRRDLSRVYPSSPRVLEALLRHLPSGRPRVLEIGAGSGRDTAALVERGTRAVAVDASPVALGLVAGLAPGLVGRGLVAADALHLPFADRVFDAVFHQGVLEHFGNAAAFLAENRRVLAPGGVLVVDVPQTWHPWTVLKRTLVRADRWFAGWETDYTPAGLERLVREAGLEVLDRYGAWMAPSLAYRLAREVAGRAGIELPLRLPAPDRWRRARRDAARILMTPRWTHRLAHTIGIVARRPEVGPLAG